jgi:hypothetical protein
MSASAIFLWQAVTLTVRVYNYNDGPPNPPFCAANLVCNNPPRKKSPTISSIHPTKTGTATTLIKAFGLHASPVRLNPSKPTGMNSQSRFELEIWCNCPENTSAIANIQARDLICKPNIRYGLCEVFCWASTRRISWTSLSHERLCKFSLAGSHLGCARL